MSTNVSTKKQVLNQLLTDKKGRVPVSFWHHFSAASGIDLNGYEHPEIIENNITSTAAYVDEVNPDFVKLMSDGLFNYTFNQDPGATNQYSNLRPIADDNPWLTKTADLVSRQKRVIGSRLGFYNVFSPVTLLKWALSEDENGKHNKKLANQLITDAIVNDFEQVKQALDVITQDVIKQVQSAINAGADGIYYSTQAIQDDRFNHELFQELIERNDQKVLKAANELSDANILHICGNGGSRNPLEWYRNYDAAVINWATDVESTSLAEGQKIFDGKVVLGGLGNTVNDVLYTGDANAIKQTVDKIIKAAGTHNVILGANCTVPRDIKLSNLQTAVKAVQ